MPTKRAEKLLAKLAGQTLHARSDDREQGMRRGGLAFWLEPSGRSVGPATAKEVIGLGCLEPLDGLFPDTPQSWRAKDAE